MSLRWQEHHYAVSQLGCPCHRHYLEQAHRGSEVRVQVECDDGAEGSYNLVYTGPETGLEAEGLEVRHVLACNVPMRLPLPLWTADW